MTVSLDGLPYDILFYIASSIHLDDVVHLSQTCRQLRSLLDERTLQRCVVESFNHAKETALAQETPCQMHTLSRLAFLDKETAFYTVTASYAYYMVK
ncbi:hypothetical protein HBI60_101430 [Parastagonospora nodorum]|nr:hypothetical protein HBI60_101430 [Parastagonospora nodorum]